MQRVRSFALLNEEARQGDVMCGNISVHFLFLQFTQHHLLEFEPLQVQVTNASLVQSSATFNKLITFIRKWKEDDLTKSGLPSIAACGQSVDTYDLTGI